MPCLSVAPLNILSFSFVTTVTGEGLHHPDPTHRGASALRELRPRGVRGRVGGLLHRQPARGGVRPPVQAHEVSVVPRACRGEKWYRLVCVRGLFFILLGGFGEKEVQVFGGVFRVPNGSVWCFSSTGRRRSASRRAAVFKDRTHCPLPLPSLAFLAHP